MTEHKLPIQDVIPRELMYNAEILSVIDQDGVTTIKDKRSHPEEYVMINFTRQSLHHLNLIFAEYHQLKREKVFKQTH